MLARQVKYRQMHANWWRGVANDLCHVLRTLGRCATRYETRSYCYSGGCPSGQMSTGANIDYSRDRKCRWFFLFLNAEIACRGVRAKWWVSKGWWRGAAYLVPVRLCVDAPSQTDRSTLYLMILIDPHWFKGRYADLLGASRNVIRRAVFRWFTTGLRVTGETMSRSGVNTRRKGPRGGR